VILISHRGNLIGPDRKKENSPEYIDKALSLGYDVEVDVWYDEYSFYLGHDIKKYKVDVAYLKNNMLWCHAKNQKALEKMLEAKIHCFWHQADKMTLTSKGYIWYYPGAEQVKKGIDVMPENYFNIDDYSRKPLGVCSDYIKKFKIKSDRNS
jgi:hypothetical protein